MKCAHTRIRASVALVLVAENGAEDKSYNLKKKKKMAMSGERRTF